MKILLDTHMLLWSLNEDPRLPAKAIDMITNANNKSFYSIISVWEVAIKHMKNPEKMKLSHRDFIDFCYNSKLMSLSLELKHVDELATLKSDKHRDPFDRMLIAQAKAEDMILLTHDDLLGSYEESCVIVV